MSINTDWDVDSYKTEHECDEHWELRRSFMLAHKDKFPEDRLVCLAQVFTNVEFLGCRYPAETMKLVSSLADGVADTYRNKQKDRLKRTFVQASDAATAKAKGLKRPLEQEKSAESTSPSTSKSESSFPNKLGTNTQESKRQNDSFSVKTTVPNKITHFVPASAGLKVTYGPLLCGSDVSKKTEISPQSSAFNNSAPPMTTLANSASGPQNSGFSTVSIVSSNGSSRFTKYGGVKTYHIDQSSAGKFDPGTFTDGPYGNFIIVEPAYASMSANQIIMTSAAACRLRMESIYEGQNPTECKIFLNERLLSSATADTKREANKLASSEGLKKLKQFYYTIQIKEKIMHDSTVETSLFKNSLDKSSMEPSKIDVPIEDNNIGNKLLRLMGWSGGGLGKAQQGIAEPVRVQENVSRTGLGLPSNGKQPFSNMIRSKIRNYIQDYARGNSEYDLVFSKEFTRDERKMVHQVAQQLKLKSKSYGKDEERFLVVSKKVNVFETARNLLQDGGSSERYELKCPEQITD